MSELSNLANHLESPSLSSARITDGLRALGFRASIYGLRQALAVSSALSSNFQQLAEIFPGAQKILSDFQLSNEIQLLLNAAPNIVVEGAARSRHSATPFCKVLASSEFKLIDFDKYPLLGEIYSFLWLTHTSIYASQDLVLSERLVAVLRTSLNFARITPYIEDDYPEFENSWNVSLRDDISDWIDAASEAIFQATTSIGLFAPSSQKIRAGLFDAYSLICKLSPLKNDFSQTESLQDEVNEDPSTGIPHQRGSGLSERERLYAFHNAFQNEEIKALSRDIISIIEGADAFSADFSAIPPYYVEATIVALALATGRSVEGAILFPLVSDIGEYLILEKFSGFEGNHDEPVWVRKLPSGEVLKLPIPQFLSNPLKRALWFDGATVFEECLPYSLCSWEERCFTWLEKKIKGSRYQINRRIRDALARAIFKSSASSSLLSILASPPAKSWREPESLSNYLNPFSERTINTYADACTLIFHKYGVEKEVQSIFGSRSNFAVSDIEHRKIARYFQNDLKESSKSGDYIAYHNSLARYLLMLLIVATGHRKSASPFFFHWDILSNDNLVFVCDKLVVGSEARFLPIPCWISELVRDYGKHLHILSGFLNPSNPGLALSIRHNADGGDPRVVLQPEQVGVSSSLPQYGIFGHFFIIDKNNNARTITTRDLEKFYMPVSTKGIGALRKCIANSLWTDGLSGHQIEAFLGHNGERHAFGESSAWSIQHWANQLRSAQEGYLHHREWKSVKINLSGKLASTYTPLLPSYDPSHNSYEGRNRDAHVALSTARKIIRDSLPSEWFTDKNAKITDEDVLLLKESALTQLGQDPESVDKLNQALAQEIDRIRNYVGGSISSTIANLTRFEAGPIAVTSSRHYAIASGIRSWWITGLGNYSNDQADNYIDRLAHIGISLIVFDAVLDIVTWKAALSAISRHESYSAKGCLIVRCQILRSSRIFDKAIILSPYTAAQIIGFELKHHSSEPTKSLIKDITQRINRCLKGAPRYSEKFTFEQLIAVFRSWWMLRLPGAQFAIAAGDYSGPAPDIVSECALYDIPYSDPAALTSPDTEFERIVAETNHDHDHAITEFDRLLKKAKGVLEKKEATSRYQRNRLMLLLREKDHLKLRDAASQKQIVSLMLDFLQYLIEEGGKRLDILAFGSIRTYFSHVKPLIEILWNREIEDLTADDYNEIYAQLLLKSSQGKVPLALFHEFLRVTFNVPYSSTAANHSRVAIMCRSALITPLHFEKAWKEVGKIQKDDGQLIHHSKSYLCLGYDYGLRSKEAFGLGLNHMSSCKPLAFRIVRNNVRDLKSNPSLRVVTPLLESSKQHKHLNDVIEFCKRSPVLNESLFANTELVDQLYSTSRIGRAVTIVLRAATGNLSVVPYSMRHSAATILSHFSFRSPRTILISEQVNTSLKGKFDERFITSCFDQGFDAWPFMVDRVAMFLGHSGVDTLLNTYWHTSHVHLAEHTWFASEDIELIDQQQLAAMLGRERSSISKQIKRLESLRANETDNRVNHESLIVHYTIKSNIPQLGDDLLIDRQHINARNLVTADNVSSSSILWVSYDRLLCTRLDLGLTFEQTHELAHQFKLNMKDAQRFTDAYQEIVLETGFDDFEPHNSSLLTSSSKFNSGALRGAMERERGITASLRLFKTSPSYADKLKIFTDIWTKRIDPDSPWFVARNKEEVALVVDVLVAIGVMRSQLEFAYFDFDMSSLRRIVTAQELATAVAQPSRISAGPAKSRIPEVGVRVRQMKDSKIGDNRDTHRLALILSVIARAGRAAEG